MAEAAFATINQASEHRRISPATVFEAYYLLEARGLIEARPRSGYYVSQRPASAAPAASRPRERSTQVEISDLVFEVLGSTRDRNVVPLGSAFPLLARHEVPLIEDDVYAELYFAAKRPLPAKAFDRRGLVMHCSSFSKCLAPGYRVGWVSAGRFAQQVERMKLMTTLSAAIPSQQALSGYLDHGGYDRHLRKLRQALQKQRDRNAALIVRHFPQGTRVTRPEGGYFHWVELPSQIDALQLHELALAQQISIAPGHLFSASDSYRHCVRINYGHPDDARCERAIRTVGELATQLARK